MLRRIPFDIDGDKGWFTVDIEGVVNHLTFVYKSFFVVNAFSGIVESPRAADSAGKKHYDSKLKFIEGYNFPIIP